MERTLWIHCILGVTKRVGRRYLCLWWMPLLALWLCAAMLPSRADTFSTLHSFSAYNAITGDNADGVSPAAALIQANDGNLYGTTYYGGANNTGTIFKITPEGNFKTLHSFSAYNAITGANTDGVYPYAALVQASDGNLYGTTAYGGANGNGTIFKITTDGVFTTFYSFSAYDDGANPHASLIQASDGDLYGSTSAGGANGVGTIFKITTDGTFTTIHNFSTYVGNGSEADGERPSSALIQASDGNLYGTAYAGGEHGTGTIFKVTTDGVFSTIHNFSAYGSNFTDSDGDNPLASLVQAGDGNLYGSAFYGGEHGTGTLFKLTTGLSPAPPTIASLNPSSVPANTAFTLTIQGSGFNRNTVAMWRGEKLVTTFINSSKLTAVVPITLNEPLQAYPGSVPIYVSNPDHTVAGALLSITTPTPILEHFTPASLPAGSPARTLTLVGNAFAPGAVVNWNNTTLVTTFVSVGKLTAQIPAAYLANKQSVQVSVTNPNGGGSSKVLTFTIN